MRFKLEPSDLEGSSETNPIIQRYEARKWLTIHPAVDKKAVEEDIVGEATRLAADNSRVVVLVRRPADAQAIADGIRRKLKSLPDAVEVLTGAMRGLERDELLRIPVWPRVFWAS